MIQNFNLRIGLVFFKKETYFNTKNNIIHLILMLVAFFGSSTAFGQTTVNITTTGNGTWTAPCDVTSITLEVWGAGGGGQRAEGNPSAGGGGSGGGYIRTTYAVTPGTTYNLFVGNGGSGVTGSNGQPSWFDTNTTIIAVGGRGAGGAVTANNTWGTGATAFTTGNNGGTIISTYGGNGGNAGNNFSGGGGSSAGDTVGNDAAGITAGAAPTNGYAGATGRNTTGVGVTGGIGAGGAGGRTNTTDRSGGAGGRGHVRITYTSTLAAYCSPTFTSGIEPITNVTFAGINNTTSNTVNGTPALESFCITGTVMQGSATNAISVMGNTAGNFTNNIRVYIDWDKNGTFGNVANEIYNIGTITNSTGVDFISLTGNIAVPLTAGLGLIKMRVMKRYNGYSSGPCQTGAGYGQAEDYLLNVIAPLPCVTPTAQPTALVLTSSEATINGTFTAASPTANNYLVVMNTSGVAPIPVNGTTYIIGSTALGGTNVVIDTDGNTNFSATLLSAVTNYYFFVFSMNNLCTGGPLYNTTSPLTGSAITPLSYCASIPTTAGFNDGITRVRFNTIDNSTSANAGNEYTNYTTTHNTTVTQGIDYNIDVWVNTDGNYTQVQMVWFDWNLDGDFDDAGEAYNLGTVTNSANGLSSLCPFTIQIPINSSIGATRMRVSSRFSIAGSPCENGQDGEVEDYSVTILAAPPCTAPTAQPTALILTPGATSITGTFTAAVPAPQNYLVLMNTTGVAPTALLTNGTTYPTGTSIGVGNIVIDTDSNTTFTASGLNTTSTYYFFIYSMNAKCSGGPIFNTNPTILIGNTTTVGTPPGPCIPTTASPRNSDRYISRVAFIGTYVETNNTSTFSNITPGYQDFTGLPTKAQQVQGEGVNMLVESTGGRARLHAWVDWNKNGTFEATEMVYGPAVAGISNTFGFAIPSGAVPGDYRVRVRTFNSFYNDGNPFNGNPDEYFGLNFDACQPFNTGTFGAYSTNQYGEAEDYLFTVIERCDVKIVSITEGEICGPGQVPLSVTGSPGTTSYNWYNTEFGGVPFQTTLTGNWTTSPISSTSTFYVTAVNGCEAIVRTPIVAKVSPLPTLSFTPSNPIICGDNAILALTAAGDKELFYLIDEDFESGTLGVFSNLNTDANNNSFDNLTRWTVRTSTFIPNGPVWKPAISSGFGSNKFAMTTADISPSAPNEIENSLTLTSGLNTTNYLNLTLTMKLYYSRYLPDNDTFYTEYVIIESSTNNFATSNTLANYIVDMGIGTKFSTLSFDLSSLINQTNVKIRIRHRTWSSSTGWLGDGAAVDDIKLFGEKPLTTSFNYDTSTVDAFSDPSCTPGTEYNSGTPASTIYIRPTITQLENSNFTIPVSTTLSNGCSVAGNIVVINNSKIYNNPTDSNWNNPANWKPTGIPNANNCVIIYNDTDITGTNYQAFAKNLRVQSTGNLNLGSSNFLTVTEKVTIVPGGIFDIENNGSMVQIDNVTNSGDIIYRRIASGIKGGDYVYWSSPVSNQALNSIYTTPTQGPKYKWNTTLNNGNGILPNISQGTWVNANGNTMETGKGYIVRGSSSSSMAATSINSTFSGVPNNGTIPVTIERGVYTGIPYAGVNGTQITNLDDNWNLLGNPYPSAINALQFLYDNSSSILGNVRLWTHGSDIALTNGTTVTNPFYGSFAYNYNSSDYLFINYLGTTIPTASDLIKTGQAFFVQMVDGPGNSSGTVNFNNLQRSNTYANDNFYRNSTENENTNGIIAPERHRIWLDIVNSNNNSVVTLLGYADGATQGKDSFFDAMEKTSGSMGIYSLIDAETFAIQGRSLPFDISDEVPLCYNVSTPGTFHIAIRKVDGLFETQNIYLKDELLNSYHDLKAAPYLFTTDAGVFTNRFKIVYQNQTFGIPDNSDNQVIVYRDNAKSIQISTGNHTMNKVKVYDISGRLLVEKTNIDSNLLTIDDIKGIADQVLLVTILTNENRIINKKVF
ncbi:GEVED domain-containing protein [Flavobacterium sp.]|uniref:GEVED domain-containing protein n=1 Tax=Flavobacterium sp. TaxID=239 RepID=UPI0025C51389|nr:GEVED domain-containing protein [Flavobacterium sp.]MBA4153759.1 hypothetical protein [Flavobacterium sp.]